MNNKTHLVILAGKKQSGKTSTADFLTANEMLIMRLIDGFSIDIDNNIVVKKGDESAVINFSNQSRTFKEMMDSCVYPHIRPFGFADRLKKAVNLIFGIPLQLLYGSDEDKNSLTKITQQDFLSAVSITTRNAFKKDVGTTEGYMSIRQILQWFGTDVCRKIKETVWVDGLIEDVFEHKPQIAVIHDCRFKNELYAFDDIESNEDVASVTKILFRRGNSEDSHSSENDIEDVDISKFDLVIDNNSMTLPEKNEKVLSFLVSKGITEFGMERD